MTRLQAILTTGMFVLLTSTAGNTVVAQNNDDAEIDHLELAALLIRDGNYDRAEAVLGEAPVDDEEFDLARYHTLYGMMYLQTNQLESAIASFNDSIDAGQTEEVIYIYLAQAHFGLEQYAQTIEALDQSGETGARLPSVFMMKAHSYWLQEQREQALGVLYEAQARFPANRQFARREIFYLIELGLFQRAAELGVAYLSGEEGTETDYVAIGNALRKSGDLAGAEQFLQMAKLKFPHSINVNKVLGQVFLEKDHFLSAANVLAEAAMLEPKLNVEAAEVYRRAGKLHRALSLNARVLDQKAKHKQRLAILLQMEDYDQVVGMEEALYRNALFSDEDVRYALAYAWFKLGDFEKSEEHLGALTRSDLFNKSIELRKVMEACEEESWKCA